MSIPGAVALGISASFTLLLSPGPLIAQTYPTKPIRIVTGAVGGASDLIARLISPAMSASLSQPVVVENRGGSAVIAAESVAQAPADGYRVLVYNNTMWTLPLMRDVPYDPLKTFTPVTLLTSAPNVLVVHPSMPVRSVKELITFAKARPGALNYASGSSGSSNHLAAELFKSMARINIVRVPYKGAGPAMLALVSGETHLMFPSAGAAAPHLSSRRVRALAVASAQPSSLLPGLPTVSASGLPGYESVSIAGMFAPAGTPAASIHRLNQEVARALNNSEIKASLASDGQQVIAAPPEQLAATIKSEMVRLGKVIKDAGIKDE